MYVRRDPRLELIYDDARAQLENYPGTFDVIIGDLADPVFGGPCYQLYTDDFYKNVVSKKLNPGGIFATQSGPCGLMTAGEVFSSIHSTLKASFPTVVPYQTHIPAFADVWVCLSTSLVHCNTVSIWAFGVPGPALFRILSLMHTIWDIIVSTV